MTRFLKQTLVLTILLAVSAVAQNKPDALKTSASKFKLLASGVVYSGIKSRLYLLDEYKRTYINFDTFRKFKIGDTYYYQANYPLDYNGLAAENAAEKTCVVYPLIRMAEAVGWYKSEKNPSYPDNARGLFLVGDTLFMGSNGVGVVAFDTVKKTWSRYDAKTEVIPGAHVDVYFADADYMFISYGEYPGARLHIYSIKLDKWLKLDAVPARSVVALGHNKGGEFAVQIEVDDRIYADRDYLPIDWHLALLSKVSREDDSYLFEKDYFKNPKTAFRITKQQLETAFAAVKEK